jgi:SAM-dependent methyltransferase
MSAEDSTGRAPGSGGWLDHASRRSDLNLPELIAELQSAVTTLDDLSEPAQIGMLLGGLCAELDGRLDVHSNRFSRCRSKELASWFAGHPAMNHELLRGGTFVELGCGGKNPLSSLAILVAAGAQRGIGVDLDRLDEGVAMRALARTVIELIAAPDLYLAPYPIRGEEVRGRFEALDLEALFAGRAEGLGDSGLSYRQVAADATGIETGTVSGIASRSFLEHVPDPDAVIAEMARTCRAGAVGSHAIDGMGHRHYGSPAIAPLESLTEESEERLLHECNRLRPLQFVEIFERHGFEVLEVQRHRSIDIPAPLRERMVDPWRSSPTVAGREKKAALPTSSWAPRTRRTPAPGIGAPFSCRLPVPGRPSAAAQ